MHKFGAGAELLVRAHIERRSLETTEVKGTAASSGDSDLCSVTQLNEHFLLITR